MTSSGSSAVSKWDKDDDYTELYLNRSKKLKEEKDSDSSPSPPSYAVFEDEDGNLVNPALNVTWPRRPLKGRYSLDEYREQKQLTRQRNTQYDLTFAVNLFDLSPFFRGKECVKHLEREPDISHANTSKRTKHNNIYIGVRSTSDMRSVLRPTEFRLFYMRPESMNSFDQMPVKMPLMLAYMSSSGKLYNFSFKRHEYTSETFWQLDLSDIGGPQQPIFRSMSALVKHYKSFVVDCGNGRSEIFPVD
uniref:SH2 domain-containing protein n=1 Tax=Elaeophora elaphi TaxID=1147741 RepID=A0A0R3RH11_9BILA